MTDEMRVAMEGFKMWAYRQMLYIIIIALTILIAKYISDSILNAVFKTW